MRNGCNEAIDKEVCDAIIESNAIPEWNEYLAEMNKVNEYEARYWQTFNRIRYLNTWIKPTCEVGLEIHMRVETEVKDIEAQLMGLKGGLYLNYEDAKTLLKLMY